MQLCDDGHDEIVHDSKNCPLCEANGKIADLEKELEGRNEEIDGLEDDLSAKDTEIEELNEKIAELQNG